MQQVTLKSNTTQHCSTDRPTSWPIRELQDHCHRSQCTMLGCSLLIMQFVQLQGMLEQQLLHHTHRLLLPH